MAVAWAAARGIPWGLAEGAEGAAGRCGSHLVQLGHIGGRQQAQQVKLQHNRGVPIRVEDAARVLAGGVQAEVKEADVLRREVLDRLALPTDVLAARALAAKLADDEGRATRLLGIEKVLAPHLGQVAREVTLPEVALHERARAVRVRSVDELGVVHQIDWVRTHAHEVFAPPVAAALPAVLWRAHRDALDKDEPARALGEDVVAEALGGQIPPGRCQPLSPRRLVRLVVKVDADDIPVAAQLLRQLGPALLDARLWHLIRVPQAVARPAIRREPVRCDHDENVAAGRRPRRHLDHLNVRYAVTSLHADEIRVLDGIDDRSRDGRVVEDGLVVE